MAMASWTLVKNSRVRFVVANGKEDHTIVVSMEDLTNYPKGDKDKDGDVIAIANFPSRKSPGKYIKINTKYKNYHDQKPDGDSKAYCTAIHELGHILGLGHPGTGVHIDGTKTENELGKKLFSIPSSFRKDLNKRFLSENLKAQFANHHSLASPSGIVIDEIGKRWGVYTFHKTKFVQYRLVRKITTIDVYAEETVMRDTVFPLAALFARPFIDDEKAIQKLYPSKVEILGKDKSFLQIFPESSVLLVDSFPKDIKFTIPGGPAYNFTSGEENKKKFFYVKRRIKWSWNKKVIKTFTKEHPFKPNTPYKEKLFVITEDLKLKFNIFPQEVPYPL